MSGAHAALAQVREGFEKSLGAVESPSGTNRGGGYAAPIDPQERARVWLNGIRARTMIFDPPLCEGAWIILLDLFANSGGKPVSVTSACIASGYPITTALRWIKEMVAIELISRTADQADGRRFYLELTERAYGAIFSYLNSWSLHPVHCHKQDPICGNTAGL